jgi:hypothetical protein
VPLTYLRCLMLNAGGTFLTDKDAARVWATQTATDLESRPHLAFVQEVPSECWLDAWRERGYRVILGYPRGWTVRSAILTLLPENECPPLTIDDVPELAYHGEYVAAARLIGWGDAGADLTLLSVHASPNPTTPDYLRHHPDPQRLQHRAGGQDPRHRGKLFDSDVVLDTIAQYAPSVLACGDLNEALGWDEVDAHAGHTWGKEFFGDRVDGGGRINGAVQRLDLVAVPLDIEGLEVVTRRAPGHPALQLDHILTSSGVASRVRDINVHSAWQQETPAVPGLADHAPVRFCLWQGP